MKRHCDSSTGKAHNYAMTLERRTPSSPFVVPSVPKQTSIIDSSKAATEQAHRKLLQTAYHLAMTPTMPLSHFEVLVKVQRTNGVKLIQGKHDGRSAKEYISALAEAVEEKCAVILGSKNFMTLLSDGSQARKTKSDKEMVMIRIERNGLPCYIVASLIEMSEWGGTGAEALKDGIDGIFTDDGIFKINSEDYKLKLVGCTADGASVNFGQHTGLLTRLDEERGWLIKIHCANHRTELAVKDAFKESVFNEVDTMYNTLFNLIKNSGKIKEEVKAAAAALNIQNYTLPKLTGTRFIGHRVSAYKALLNMWPAIITALENVVADSKIKSETKSKATGMLRKHRSYEILAKTCVYLDLLEAVRPASKVFEGEGLMIHEVKSTINMTTLELSEFEDCDDIENDITSHIRRFFPDGENAITTKNFAPGDGLRKEKNRSYTHVDMTPYLVNISNRSIDIAFNAKKKFSGKIKEMLQDRFDNSYGDNVINAMKWFDIKNWRDEKEYGYEDFAALYTHFEESLNNAGYEPDKVKKEWGRVRHYILSNFKKSDESRDIWCKVLLSMRKDFPNIVILIELIISFSGSNSTVERAFSLLTNMLSDRRLSTAHATMNMLMKVKLSDSLWNDVEREEVLTRALEIFLSKRRRVQVDNDDVAVKKRKIEINEKSKYGKEVCEWIDSGSDTSDSDNE